MTIEAFGVAEMISGEDVVEDVCHRIAESLSADCRLRPTDSYQGYSAKATIEIWLSDVDPQSVKKSIVIGSCGSGQTPRQIEVDMPLQSPREVHERGLPGTTLGTC